MVSEVRYHPYGQERWTSGSTPTDFGFTSQRNEASFGLMDYNARYYSPVLGRFVSPDSIVPEPTSSSGFNRYRYTRNNPIRYTDPSGHGVPDTCLYCDQDLIDVSNWPGWAKNSVGLAVSLTIGGGYDSARNVIRGPTAQEYADNAMLSAMPGALAFKSVAQKGISFAGRKVFGEAVSDIPLGFQNADEFLEFGSDIYRGLKNAAIDDATVIFQGSSVTGKKYTTGAAFDDGRISDFDIAIASETLLQKAGDLGIGLRSSGTRTGPIKGSDLEKLGLTDLVAELTEKAGRPVNIMIYDSAEKAINRTPGSILIEP